MPESIFTEDIEYLQGVSPKKAAVLAEGGVHSFRDLLHYFPRRYLDRSTVTAIRDLQENEPAVTIVGTVRVSGVVPGKRTRRFELIVEDEQGDKMKCVWFQGVNWIPRLFKNGERVAVHGKVQRYGGRFSMTHPEFDKLDAEGPALDTGRIITLYPGSAKLQKAGLTSRTFRRIIYGLFKDHGLKIPYILPPWIQERYDLLDGRVPLRAIANIDDGNQIMCQLIADDVIATPDLTLIGGNLGVWDAPGLGFTLDPDTVARAAERARQDSSSSR